MSAADPQHIAFACLAYLLLDISDTVDRIGSYPLEWHSRGYRACDHSRRKLWFGRKARAGRHVCGLQTIWIVGPFLWKIQRAIDERMAMTGNVGREDADLAVRNLACRTGVLPRHTARRVALLEKAGLVDDEDGIVICQMLDDIVAHDIAQGIGIPIPATKDSLLPPWTRIASCLRPHPAGLALLITEQTFQKQACVPRNPFLPEQWTYPLLKLLKRRSPQRKRLFNRRCLRPRSSNHGCPWIQKSSERATVMLERDDFSSNRHPALAFCLSMISAQTLRVCREGKPVPTHRVVARGHAFPDHALLLLRAASLRASVRISARPNTGRPFRARACRPGGRECVPEMPSP